MTELDGASPTADVAGLRLPCRHVLIFRLRGTSPVGFNRAGGKIHVCRRFIRRVRGFPSAGRDAEAKPMSEGISGLTAAVVGFDTPARSATPR